MGKTKSGGTKSVESQDPELLVVRSAYFPRALDEQLSFVASRREMSQGDLIRALVGERLKLVLDQEARKEEQRIARIKCRKCGDAGVVHEYGQRVPCRCGQRFVLRSVYLPRALDERVCRESLKRRISIPRLIHALAEAGLRPIWAQVEREGVKMRVRLHNNLVGRITRSVAKKFSSFGGGSDSDANPIVHAMKDAPPQFAAGVPIERVVRFILSHPKEVKVKKIRSRVISKAGSLQEKKQRAR